MAIEQSACDLGGMACSFFASAAKANLGLVVLGGLCGGLLQPVYARLNPDRPNPATSHAMWCALLGLAAAGISVYVVANSQTDQPIRLLFFSVLCGLAFPSVLTSAVDSVGKRTEQVQRDVAQIAKDAKSDDMVTTAQAADQLKTTLARNPIDAIGSKGVPVVEATAQIAVQNIAETATNNPATTAEVINQLQQVGAVAKTAGYTATVKTAAAELAKLGEGPASEEIKAIARDAADRLGGN